MKRFIILVGILIALVLSSVLAAPPDWKHAAPPPGDELLTNRFGHSWSEPITNGYLIVDGKYIDAPYVVEQRGYVIFVNNVLVEDGIDVRLALPEPPPSPVTTDPGFPTNLTKNSSIGEVTRDPIFLAKLQYWAYKGIYGKDRVQSNLEFLVTLPCVSKVEDTGHPGLFGTRLLRLWDHHGGTIEFPVAMVPMPPRTIPSDEELYKQIKSTRSYIEGSLNSRELVIVRYGSVIQQGDHITPEPKWRERFDVLFGKLPAEAKVKRLKALGFLGEKDNLRTAQRLFPLDTCHASTQLTQRVNADNAWHATAPAMLRSLTNNWQRIAPKFEREKTPLKE